MSLAQDTPHNCGSGKEVVSQLDGKVRELVNKRATSSKATSLTHFFFTIFRQPMNESMQYMRLLPELAVTQPIVESGLVSRMPCAKSNT